MHRVTWRRRKLYLRAPKQTIGEPLGGAILMKMINLGIKIISEWLYSDLLSIFQLILTICDLRWLFKRVKYRKAVFGLKPVSEPKNSFFVVNLYDPNFCNYFFIFNSEKSFIAFKIQNPDNFGFKIPLMLFLSLINLVFTDWWFPRCFEWCGWTDRCFKRWKSALQL